MPKPLHVLAFEHFNDDTENAIEAIVAFGLFMESERLWELGQPREPTEGKYRDYHQIYLTPHETERYRIRARETLTSLANDAREVARETYLQDSLDRYHAAAEKGHKQFRLWGVVEAFGGAFFWSVLLIVFSIIIAWNGIDILEYYHKAAQTTYQHSPAPAR